ncbi:hypothetical protein [Bdellovibrio sp. NC01]|uniref:CHASE3 domain-containing protein n=1 Tax=Bdellovibrio sp. NC01 TaxID=2220073 RepID=UPI00115C19C1|nr:hypothetical protein [Bdellovibrio sp. NC01]QDK38367.1 hypothetical protein DOE51_12645 [Bdellovibrio sp. NC01]
MFFESFLNYEKRFRPVTFLLMAILLCYAVWLSFAIESTADSRFDSLQLAEELRHSSRDLTKNARAYVVTGDIRYYDDYKKVLATRDGKVARPDGRTIPLQTLIKNSGVTNNELALLTEAQKLSDQLSAVEFTSMNLVKDNPGPASRDAATRTLYGVGYSRTTEEIVSPIVNLENSINIRTKEEIGKSSFLLRTVLVLVLGLLALLKFASYALHNKSKNQL